MPRTEKEMGEDLLIAHEAGNTELAQRIADQIRASRAPKEGPGILSQALTFASEGPEWVRKQKQEERQKMIAGGGDKPSGLLPLHKDSGDAFTGMYSFLQGMPGNKTQHLQPTESLERMGRFRKEHPALGFLLPMAGGMAMPLPAGEARASYYPPANPGLRAGEQTLQSIPAREMSTYPNAMRDAADSLKDLPQTGINMSKIALGALGGHTIPGIGGEKGALLMLAIQAARKYGPGAAASILRGGAATGDVLGPNGAISGIQMLRGAIEAQNQNRSVQPQE